MIKVTWLGCLANVAGVVGVDQASFWHRLADVLKQKQPGFSVTKFKTGTESCLPWVSPTSSIPLFRQSLTVQPRLTLNLVSLYNPG